MLPKDRNKIILDIVKNQHYISIEDLCSQLFCSKATIMRAVHTLESQGMILRKNKGIAPVFENIDERNFSFKLRDKEIEKQIIANFAANLINEKIKTIFLDSSSTCYFLANKIVSLKYNINIITYGLETAKLLSKNLLFNVYNLGGLIIPHKNSMFSNFTLQNIDSFFADIAFVSCRGFDFNKGTSEFIEIESVIKQKYYNNSTKLILLIEHSKFDTIYPFKSLDIDQIKMVITNKKPNEKYIKLFKKHNIKIIWD